MVTHWLVLIVWALERVTEVAGIADIAIEVTAVATGLVEQCMFALLPPHILLLLSPRPEMRGFPQFQATRDNAHQETNGTDHVRPDLDIFPQRILRQKNEISNDSEA